MGGKHPQWSAEDIAVAREMMRKGHKAAEIAAVLGRTRNAVIGACNRYPELVEIGLQYRQPSRVSSPKPPRPPRRTEKLITELTSAHCQWPLWAHHERPTPETAFYCGQPAVRGSYCAKHAAMAYHSRTG